MGPRSYATVPSHKAGGDFPYGRNRRPYRPSAQKRLLAVPIAPPRSSSTTDVERRLQEERGAKSVAVTEVEVGFPVFDLSG
jgi:hypothetical protein